MSNGQIVLKSNWNLKLMMISYEIIKSVFHHWHFEEKERKLCLNRKTSGKIVLEKTCLFVFCTQQQCDDRMKSSKVCEFDQNIKQVLHVIRKCRWKNKTKYIRSKNERGVGSDCAILF